MGRAIRKKPRAPPRKPGKIDPIANTSDSVEVNGKIKSIFKKPYQGDKFGEYYYSRRCSYPFQFVLLLEFYFDPLTPTQHKLSRFVKVRLAMISPGALPTCLE